MKVTRSKTLFLAMITAIVWLLWATPAWNYYLSLQGDDADSPISDSSFTKIIPTSWDAIATPSFVSLIFLSLFIFSLLVVEVARTFDVGVSNFSIRAPPVLSAFSY